MKTCSKCRVHKPVSEFNKKGKTRYQAYCRECTRIIGRETYHKDREANAAKQNANKKKRMDAIKLYLRQLRESTPCMDCGQHYRWYQMDFDHVTGNKTRSISEMVQQGAAKWRIMSEVTKCEIVCSNCHRQRTFMRIGLSYDPEMED